MYVHLSPVLHGIRFTRFRSYTVFENKFFFNEILLILNLHEIINAGL